MVRVKVWNFIRPVMVILVSVSHKNCVRFWNIIRSVLVICNRLVLGIELGFEIPLG